MIGNYTFKFYGIIKGFDLDNINRDTFPILISANIFDVAELSPYYIGGEYFGIELNADSWCISDFYLFNQQQYSLKNEIYEDMFDRCEFRCESSEALEEGICDVDLNVDFEVSDYSKIRYLKLKIAEMNHRVVNQSYYLLYCKKIDVDSYRSWYDYFISEQVENGDFDFIYKYLVGEDDFVPDFILSSWSEFFLVKNLTDYCKKKINLLERTSGIKESDIIIDIKHLLVKKEKITADEKEVQKFSSAIFCENGEELFKYIISRYPRAHNKAFFSYLYFYLRDKMKIVLLGNDSREYRDYVIDNYDINSFTKIQVTVNDNTSSMKNKVHEWFNIYYSDFIKLKENGRKNELK